MNKKELYDLALSRLDYDPEIGGFRWRDNYSGNTRKGDVAGSIRNNVWSIGINREVLSSKFLVWYLFNNEILKNNRDICHINGVSGDNRIENLIKRVSYNRSYRIDKCISLKEGRYSFFVAKRFGTLEEAQDFKQKFEEFCRCQNVKV